MTLGVLLVVLTYVSSFYHPVRSLTRLTSVLARAAASRERLLEVLLSVEVLPEPASPVAAPAGAVALTFGEVTFAYRLPGGLDTGRDRRQVPLRRRRIGRRPSSWGPAGLRSRPSRRTSPAGTLASSRTRAVPQSRGTSVLLAAQHEPRQVQATPNRWRR